MTAYLGASSAEKVNRREGDFRTQAGREKSSDDAPAWVVLADKPLRRVRQSRLA
jgi:hypothetical protein